MTVAIESPREALHKMHARAMGDTSVIYMSIPADRARDADLMLSDALDELAEYRKADRDAFGAGFRRGVAEGLPGVSP